MRNGNFIVCVLPAKIKKSVENTCANQAGAWAFEKVIMIYEVQF